MKTIRIIGNSGKTTFCYYLARQLSYLGNKTVVISTDQRQPPAGVLFDMDKTPFQSIGKVLSLPGILDADIFSNIIPLNDNLGYLGYSPIDNVSAYPEIIAPSVESLMEGLSKHVSYVVVDCTTGTNQLDDFLADKSDKTLCITSADKKGVMYRNTMTQIEQQISAHIMFINNKYNPLDDVKQSYQKKLKYSLPYFKDFDIAYNIAPITEIKPPRGYINTVNKIIKEQILCF